MQQPQPFAPRNDLERQLQAAQTGEMSPEDFMQELLAAQLFMPVLDDSGGIQGFQKTDQAQPLVVQGEDDVPVLILFTSPERAKGFVEEFPGYEKGGILVDVTWILERVGGGMGMIINPGWEVGIDMPAEMVEHLKAQAPAAEPGAGQ